MILSTHSYEAQHTCVPPPSNIFNIYHRLTFVRFANLIVKYMFCVLQSALEPGTGTNTSDSNWWLYGLRQKPFDSYGGQKIFFLKFVFRFSPPKIFDSDLFRKKVNFLYFSTDLYKSLQIKGNSWAWFAQNGVLHQMAGGLLHQGLFCHLVTIFCEISSVDSISAEAWTQRIWTKIKWEGWGRFSSYIEGGGGLKILRGEGINLWYWWLTLYVAV